MCISAVDFLKEVPTLGHRHSKDESLVGLELPSFTFLERLLRVYLLLDLNNLVLP